MHFQILGEFIDYDAVHLWKNKTFKILYVSDVGFWLAFSPRQKQQRLLGIGAICHAKLI